MDRAILYPGIYGPSYFMPELRKCVKVEVVGAYFALYN